MSAPTPQPALTAAVMMLAAVLAAASAGCAAQPPLLTPVGPPSAAAPTTTATSTPSPSPGHSGAGAPGILGPPTGAPVPTASTPPGRAVGLPDATTRTSADPGVVAVAGLTVAYNADTDTDTSPLDAQRRALPWFGGGYAAAISAADPPTGPGATWTTWAAHHAHLLVQIAASADDHPADTPTTADRQYLLTQTPTAPGWTGPPVTVAVYVGLTRTPDGRWQITELDQHSP